MPHFLTPLLNDPTGHYQLVNATSGAVLATTLITAFDSASRNRGLLKHTSLEPGTAMIIAPCSSVHTFFMKFPIDVVFVRKNGQVLKVRRSVPAWRFAASFTAFAAIEMAAGQVPGAIDSAALLRIEPRG